jgi:Fungalysin metallopeptidase (M36)/Fungalysin/Thermolysin Propeptide Motif/Peptidase propeptide and YPEB domain
MNNGSLLDSGEVHWHPGGRRPRSISGEFPLPPADEPEEAVVAFLEDHADELRLPTGAGAGLRAGAGEGLAVVHKAATPTGQVVRLQQQYQGTPVLDTEVVVVLDKDDRVKQLDLAHEPELRPVEPAADSELKPRDALKIAKEALGDFNQRAKPPAPSKVYYPTAEGLRLAYVAIIQTEDPPHSWRFVVDAHNGEILDRRDLIIHVDGQGMVFDPNPVVTANNDTLRDPDATAAGCGFTGTARATVDTQRVTRTLRDITADGSGNHRLEGPFVRMQEFGAPTTMFPQETNANAFNYSSGDARFEAVNVYYHIDTFQRYLQDGTQGPSVTTAHNSQIPCDPHQGSGAAFFDPADGGLHFSNSGPCRPDRSEDGHVMVHEYGHAIQNDQVPTWGGTNPVTGRAETGAMGEGYGDAMACIFFSDKGGGFRREVFEQWVFGDVGGLRRVDGTKVYPTDWASQVHADGEIWSAALWNIFRAIGGDSADPAVRAAARHEVIKTVTLSHHRMAGNASMPEGAEAVMRENAALDEYLGRHLMQMLDSFHARGLLVCDPNADLTIIDGPTFWNSPDLWIRTHDDPVTATTHQEPEFGQDNFFYARVRNQGTAAARAFVVTFNVKTWAGTEFVYPNDFLPYVSGAVGFNLAPGASTVVKAKWPEALVPPKGTHACWLASVYTPVDLTPSGAHVWEHNNLAQKNLIVVDLVPGDTVTIPVQLGNLGRVLAGMFRIELQRPKEWHTLPVEIVHKNPEVVRRLLQSIEEPLEPEGEPKGPGRFTRTGTPVVRFLEPTPIEIAHRGVATAPVRLTLGRDSSVDIEPEPHDVEGLSDALEDLGNGVSEDAGREVELVADRGELGALAFRPGATAGFPVKLRGRRAINVGLRLTAPREAKPGDTLTLDLLQRNRRGQVVGGVSVRVNVVD